MLKYKLILLSNKTTLTSLHSKGLSIFMSMPFLLRRYLSVMWIWEEKFSLVLSVVLRSFNCVEVHHPTKLIMSNHHWLFLSLCRSYWLQWSASLSPVCGRLSCVPVSPLWSPVTEALGRADQVVGVVEAVRVPGVVNLVVQRLVGGRQGVDLFLEVAHLGVKVTPGISTGCKEKRLNLNLQVSEFFLFRCCSVL